MRFGLDAVPYRPERLPLNTESGKTQPMLTLDQILDGLHLEVMPFALCEARGDGLLDLGVRSQATLHYVLDGSGVFNVAGWPAINAAAGTVLISPPSANDSLRASGSGRCEPLVCAPLVTDWLIRQVGEGETGVIVACGEISASYRGIDGLFNYLQEPLQTWLAEHDGLKSALHQLLDELARPRAGSKALVRALMQQCMIHILRQYGEIGDSPLLWMAAAQDDRLWRAVEVMLTEPKAQHSLESLSAIAQMSRSSFAEHFKASFGHGPIDLLKQIRMRLAARMLIGTDMSIKAVTREIGYASRSYFSRAFQEVYGLSPADYRLAHRSNEIR